MQSTATPHCHQHLADVTAISPKLLGGRVDELITVIAGQTADNRTGSKARTNYLDSDKSPAIPMKSTFCYRRSR